jgi:hypothetical protein
MDDLNFLTKDTWIKRLAPGIETRKEKESFANLDKHESELKDEELFYRATK